MADRYIICLSLKIRLVLRLKCSVISTDGIEKEPDEDPCRDLYMAWHGFVVLATQPIEKERIEQGTIDTSAGPAKAWKTPGEPFSC